MRPEAPAYVWDAREVATKAASIAAQNDRDSYLQEWVLQAAVERQLEIVGEALKNLRSVDPTTAGRIPDVRAIIATRNILAHAYAQVDQARVWEMLTGDLPILIPILDQILDEAGGA